MNREEMAIQELRGVLAENEKLRRELRLAHQGRHTAEGQAIRANDISARRRDRIARYQQKLHEANQQRGQCQRKIGKLVMKLDQERKRCAEIAIVTFDEERLFEAVRDGGNIIAKAILRG